MPQKKDKYRLPVGTAGGLNFSGQAAEALHEKERRFQQLLNSLDEGVWSRSLPDGRETYVNPALEEIFGRPYRDLTGDPQLWKEMFHPDDFISWQTIINDLLNKGKLRGVFRIIRPDGEIRWVEARAWLVKNDAGTPVRMEGIFIDISKRRQAEEALRESEERFRSIAEFSPLPIWIIDQNNNYEYVNPAFTSLFGYTQQDVPTGREWFKKAYPDPEYRRYVIHEWLEDSRPERKDVSKPHIFKVTCQDKKIKEILFMPVVGMKNNKSLIICQDVTRQKQVEEALQRARRRFEEIIEFLPDPTFVIDREGKVIAWNKAIEEMTKIPKEQMINRSDYEYAVPFYGKRRPILIDLAMMPTSDYKSFTKEYDLIGWSGNTLYGETYVPYTYGGKGAFLWAAASKLLDADGNLIGVIETIRDITERKRLEEQLKYYSMHDQLTGLYNRNFFEEELKRLSGGREYPITIISADVDDLKLINDSMGHDQGDKLLVTAAGVLKKALRKSDILARVGGDEFTAILPGTDAVMGESVAARIRENVASYNEGLPKLPLSLSLGVATAESEEISFKELYKQADDLMYRDKLYHSTKARNKTVQSLLTALAERDFITEGHAQRLKELCLKMGERINLSTRQLADLALLAQVHDLGKTGIPDKILFKKGELSENDWKIMRQHSEKGYKIALSSTDLSEMADLILKHHERWDGIGYPLGLKGEKIPVECRILAIVDAYDAITNDRPYNKARSREAAIAELTKCAGTQFDPGLVEVFVMIIEQEAGIR